MSPLNNRDRLAIIIHAEGVPCGLERGTCIARPGETVTCKRCLASLARRDREFHRKSRLGLASAFDRKTSNIYRTNDLLSGDAARAIAREEVRSP